MSLVFATIFSAKTSIYGLNEICPASGKKINKDLTETQHTSVLAQHNQQSAEEETERLPGKKCLQTKQVWFASMWHQQSCSMNYPNSIDSLADSRCWRNTPTQGITSLAPPLSQICKLEPDALQRWYKLPMNCLLFTPKEQTDQELSVELKILAATPVTYHNYFSKNF